MLGNHYILQVTNLLACRSNNHVQFNYEHHEISTLLWIYMYIWHNIMPLLSGDVAADQCVTTVE